MAMTKRPFGKDRVVNSSEEFIGHALAGGGMGPSKGIHDTSVSRGQTVKTALGLDNVQLAYPSESSILDTSGVRGSPTNLKHSLEGAEAVDPNDPGAAGPVKHVIIKNH